MKLACKYKCSLLSSQTRLLTEYLCLDSFYWRSASVEIGSNNLPCWMFMLAALPSTLSGYARDVWRDRVSARGERGRVRACLRAPLSAQSFLLLWSLRMVGWYYFFKVTNLFPAQLLQCIAEVIMHTDFLCLHANYLRTAMNTFSINWFWVYP